MNRSPRILAVLGLLAVLGFGWGLWQLFAIRFEGGDIYPPYSSLRSDPLGTRALFESLEAAGGRWVDRLYQPVSKLEETRDTTLFWLGDSHGVQPEDEWRGFLRGGGRLIIGWAPTQFVERGATNASGPFPWQRARYRKGPLLPVEPPSSKPEDVAFRDSWRLDLDFVPLSGFEEDQESEPARRVADLPLPAELAWHSTICFTNLHEDWRVIYERRGRPVMIERRFGTGKVVLTTDAWPVSNEALRNDRHIDLLLWWIGDRQRVLFDEHHLGVERSPGLATMMHRYRMHGLVGALTLLALLFMWRSVSTFLPRTAGNGETGPLAGITGRDAASGFVNLLRRAIRPRDLIKTCFEEWRHSQPGCSRERLRRMEQAIMSHDDAADGSRDPVATYRELHRVWKEEGR